MWKAGRLSRCQLAGDWSGIQGNFGGPGGAVDTSDLSLHQDLAALIDDPDVDVVDICLPTLLHTEWALKAIKAGKDVLIEKPIALTIEDADLIIEAAAKHGQNCFVAHVLRFFGSHEWMCDVVQNRTYGPVAAAHLWRMTAGVWWTGEPRANGGPAVDLHIHDTDLVRHLFGMPDMVSSVAQSRDGSYINHLHTQYHYSNHQHRAITSSGGSVASPPFKFNHGFDVHCQNATLRFDNHTIPDGLIYHRDEGESVPDIDSQDMLAPFTRQWEAVLSVVSGKAETCGLEAIHGRDSLALCLAEIESAITGKPKQI